MSGSVRAERKEQIFAAEREETPLEKVLPHGAVPQLFDIGSEGAPKTIGELPVEVDVEGAIR